MIQAMIKFDTKLTSHEFYITYIYTLYLYCTYFHEKYTPILKHSSCNIYILSIRNLYKCNVLHFLYMSYFLNMT